MARLSGKAVVGAKQVQAVAAVDADETSRMARRTQLLVVQQSGTRTSAEFRLGLQAHRAKASCHSALFRTA